MVVTTEQNSSVKSGRIDAAAAAASSSLGNARRTETSPPRQDADSKPIPFSFGHMLKTIGMAIALTGLFMLPQFMIHIPTGIIAPISAGYTTGGIMKVSALEAFIIGVTLFLLITLPPPVAYVAFGFANHLPFIAIAAFSLAFGAYYGTLIGVFSWIGGNWRH